MASPISRKITTRRIDDGSWIKSWLQQSRFLPVVIGLIALTIFFSSQSSVFLTSRNMRNLMVQSCVTGIMALGISFVLLIGEIDLSIAATNGVTSVLAAKFVVDFDFSVPSAIIIAVACGAIIGLVNGYWFSYFKLPSFVMTLGSGMMLNGVQLILLPRTGRYNLLGTSFESIAGSYISGTGSWLLVFISMILAVSLSISGVLERKQFSLSYSLGKKLIRMALLLFALLVSVSVLARGKGLPMPIIVLGFLLSFCLYVTTQTAFGLHLYALGDSREASRLAGIKVPQVVISAFVLSGSFAAIAGILAASRLLGVSVSSGGGIGGGALLLESIAAAVIGGVSLFGGRGHLLGVLFGALVIATVSNGLNLMGVANEIRLVVTGVLLVLSVSAERFSAKPS